MFLRHARMIAVVLVISGCTDRGADPDFGAGVPSILGGVWELTLQGENGVETTGSLRLDSVISYSGQDSTPFVSGVVDLPTLDLLGYDALDSAVEAFHSPNGHIGLHLKFAGGCGDCGDLSLRGHLAGARATGKWLQEILVEARTGEFDMRRRME